MATPVPPQPLPGARLLFSLDPAVAYLNHGSLGAVPITVQRAQQRLRDEMEANPQRFFGRGLYERIGHAARHLATFLGAAPEGAAFVPNTTIGIAVVLHSLDLRTGDSVVTTDQGYGSVGVAVDRATTAAGARHRVERIPLTASADEIVSTISDAARVPGTRLVIVDLITSPTARVFPVGRIAENLRDIGVPLLVDAAHGPGSLPLEVDAIGADFVVGNLHKWAFAPRGTGMLIVAERWRPAVRPLAVSWHHLEGYPGNVMSQGTLDYTGWLAAPTGVFALRTLGLDRVREHNAALATFAQHVVGTALRLSPAELPDPGGPIGMRLLPLPPGVATTTEQALALRDRISDELAAEVAVICWRGRGLLRLSAQVYNSPGEYERLASGLPALLGSV